MIRIMFICHGNICRSPMGEFILKDMARRDGFEDRVYIASAATTDDETAFGGGHIYPPAKRTLLSHGISQSGIDDKRARKLLRSDADKYDLFICMDSENVWDARSILGKAAEGKIKRCLDFATAAPHGRDVSDPWYTRDFEAAYSDIFAGCEGIAEYVKRESK